MEDKVNILEIGEASSLAKIISSKTSQEIINFISENEGCSASDIKNKLSLPASTVHYNLKALIEAKIIDDNDFTYSEKGKEIIHYKLTNKLIIVVPQKQKLSAQLKAFIPSLLVVGGIIAVSFITRIYSKTKLFSSGTDAMIAKSSPNTIMMADTAIASGEAMPEMTTLSSTSNELVQNSISWNFSNEFLIGLGIGFLIVISSYFLVNWLRKRKRTISK